MTLSTDNGHTSITEESFDPLADLMVGTGERPPGWAEINLRAIGPLFRALLVTDGTVTKFLEAVMMEPVKVTIASQSDLSLDRPHSELIAEAGCRLISREVTLVGARTGRHFADAASILVVDRLPDMVRDRLDDHPQGLGRILLESGLETRREVLWFGREPSSRHGKGTAGRICRTYRIISGGLPLMLITESFPRDLELID